MFRKVTRAARKFAKNTTRRVKRFLGRGGADEVVPLQNGPSMPAANNAPPPMPAANNASPPMPATNNAPPPMPEANNASPSMPLESAGGPPSPNAPQASSNAHPRKNGVANGPPGAFAMAPKRKRRVRRTKTAMRRVKNAVRGIGKRFRNTVSKVFSMKRRR